MPRRLVAPRATSRPLDETLALARTMDDIRTADRRRRRRGQRRIASPCGLGPKDSCGAPVPRRRNARAPHPRSDWWDWNEQVARPISGDGNGFATRYVEDFAVLAALGLTHHRLSMEWARLEPEPGVHDQAAVEHYRAVLTAARDAGVTPWVCLHHFTLPRWFAAQGGFLEIDGPHERLGSSRRLRGGDVRRSRGRMATRQRGELLRAPLLRRRALPTRTR